MLPMGAAVGAVSIINSEVKAVESVGQFSCAEHGPGSWEVTAADGLVLWQHLGLVRARSSPSASHFSAPIVVA
jgi:hypothetical protein